MLCPGANSHCTKLSMRVRDTRLPISCFYKVFILWVCTSLYLPQLLWGSGSRYIEEIVIFISSMHGLLSGKNLLFLFPICRNLWLVTFWEFFGGLNFLDFCLGLFWIDGAGGLCLGFSNEEMGGFASSRRIMVACYQSCRNRTWSPNRGWWCLKVIWKLYSLIVTYLEVLLGLI